jgi:hypothetical protein
MQWLRSPVIYRIVIFLLVISALLALDKLLYTFALPVKIDISGQDTTLTVGSQVVNLGAIGTPTALVFASHDPVVHEYQLDGTDSTNNFTQDTNYLHRISSSLYYRFQAWMRDLNGLSAWRDLQVRSNGRVLTQEAWPADGSTVSLPASSPSNVEIELQFQRPETPMTFNLITSSGTFSIMLDRNDRKIAISRSGPSNSPTQTFFPLDPLPFAAMVLDFLVRTVLWAVIVLLMVLAGEMLLVPIREVWQRLIAGARLESGDGDGKKEQSKEQAKWYDRSVLRTLHPVALLALVASCVYVSWIAAVQYQAEPHIYDAAAYLFAAKMYAQGHLSVPIPSTVDRFPGPFMVQSGGQWFGQYAPGTSLTLVPGIWLGMPWLVEPVLGTFALLGIGLIAARLYDRKVATLAVILGTLSPFYSYLAASYLSHTIALFYIVWGFWAMLRFVQGGRGWNVLLAALLFGMAALTRDLVAVLYVVIIVAGLLLLFRRRQEWERWITPGITFLAVAIIFVSLTFAFNRSLTGNAYVSPRTLFFAGDRWGFGPGIGFYGQHTLAAGLVNLDELLTILSIDLFGWPFYLTLAFLALPFLTLRAKGADWLMLAGAVIVTGAFTGYFYHGIYLGPRYLFETLPFLLILTSRGIFTLADWALAITQELRKWLASRSPSLLRFSAPTKSFATIALVIALVLCNLLYFLPRQIELHQNYSGLPAGYNLNLSSIYHNSLHNAIVVTSDYAIYQFVLFPLNDPLLHDDVIYAWASNTADYQELRTAFPGKSLYQLAIGADGRVGYTSVP